MNIFCCRWTIRYVVCAWVVHERFVCTGVTKTEAGVWAEEEGSRANQTRTGGEREGRAEKDGRQGMIETLCCSTVCLSFVVVILLS